MIALAVLIGTFVVSFVVIIIVTYYRELSNPPDLTDVQDVQQVEPMELPICTEIPVLPPDVKDIDLCHHLDYPDLDAQVAVENFLGKTGSEAEALFEENALGLMQDLMWMGPIAFCYYVAAAINYIKSPGSVDDSELDCFLGSVGFQLEYGRRAIAPVIPQLRAAVQYVIENWTKFDVDPEFYGDLRNQYDEMLKTLDA